ncbi:MAG: hypothetical protein AB7F86_13950 [Bdellovibrionales bacterium]
MTKQFVKWKTVLELNVMGRHFESELPTVLERRYRGTLLDSILSMPMKNGITFEIAVRMTGEKMSAAFESKRLGREPGHYNWYLNNFIGWISDQGYHIELTGDEFETYIMSNKVT